MKIRKIKNYPINKINWQNTKIVNVFYKNNYKYTVKCVENTNILLITQEDTKSELFETYIFEII